MTKRVIVFLVMLTVALTAKVYAEAAKKASAVSQPKVYETRINEADMNKLEGAISRAVMSKQGTGAWEYMAKRMKPPKNDKWIGKWNELGGEGWEAIDHFEYVYIFKRPAVARVSSYKAPEAAPAEKAVEKSAPIADDKGAKNAEKEKEKAAKKADKEAKKAAKKAEKEAKKSTKEKTKKKGE